jgi:hypothetical protein
VLGAWGIFGEEEKLRTVLLWVDMTVLHTKYCSGDKIENEMGGACSANGGEERRILGFGGET